MVEVEFMFLLMEVHLMHKNIQTVIFYLLLAVVMDNMDMPRGLEMGFIHQVTIVILGLKQAHHYQIYPGQLFYHI